MKNILCLIIFLAAVGCGQAQNDPLLHEWKATLTIVDDNNQPVSGAEAVIIYSVAPPPGQAVAGAQAKGLTDSNGVFTASHRDGSLNLVFRVQKEGYYSTTMAYEIGLLGRPINPANLKPALTLLLKKIGKPIAMYVKRVNLGMPVFGKPAGFDLMTGDWVAPYGTGVNVDIIFTARLEKRAENDSDYTLTVSFPNSGDGIQEFNAPPVRLGNGSVLRSAQEAPVGAYQAEWVQVKTRRPGQPLNTNWDEDRNFYFRVRTVMDEKGNIKSTLYGKIYGDFMQFRYYLNPTPNDRNIEFDPKHNLMGHLTPIDQVREP